MSTDQPSSAPQADAPKLRDDATAAAVLHDDALDQPAGGGGLGGPSAASAPGPAGAATPNSPIDARVPHGGGDAKAEGEARVQAAAAPPAEPGHGSR